MRRAADFGACSYSTGTPSTVRCLACTVCIYIYNMTERQNRKRLRISQVKVRLRISSERVSSTTSQLSHGQEGNNNGKSRSKTRPRRSTRNRSLHHSKRKQQPESTSSRKPGYKQHLQMCRRVARTQARMAGREGNKATQVRHQWP